MAQFPAAEGLCSRFWCSNSYPSSLPGHLGSKPLVEEELHRRDEGIGRSLSKPADGRIAHGLGEFGKQLLIPLALLKQGDRLVATDTAGRTLAAGFVLEETEEIDGDLGNIVFVGKDDDGMAADKAPYLSRVPKSSGTSARLAGRIPPEAPPGRYALNSCPSSIPPANSISLRAVMPAGATLTPGFFTRPETDHERKPLEPLTP